MATALKAIQDGIREDLTSKLTRADTIDAYMNTALFRQWQRAQVERWKTENQSEGARWLPVTPEYGNRKRTKFASYPGGGAVTMVATGKLMTAATGRGPNFLKKVTSKQAVFGVSLSGVPYASFAAEARPFMEFSDSTEDEFRRGIDKFLMQGVR